MMRNGSGNHQKGPLGIGPRPRTLVKERPEPCGVRNPWRIRGLFWTRNQDGRCFDFRSL